MVRFCLVMGLMSFGAMAFAQGSTFDFAEVNSSVPFDMRNVNNNGDVFGLLHNANGSITGSIFNRATGFHAIGLNDHDYILGSYTNGGFIYSRDSQEAGQVYRTMVGGSKVAIDLSNGGAINLSAGVANIKVSSDDRMLFQSGDNSYSWSQATGSVFLGATLQNIGFGNNGTYIINPIQGTSRLNTDGTRTLLSPPSGTSIYGQFIGYQELSMGTQVFSFLKLNNVNGSQIFVNNDYVIPAGQVTGYAISYGQQFLSGIPQPPFGQRILGLNQDGYAVVYDIQNQKLVNQPSFDVTDINGVLQTNNQVFGYNASENYVLGRATGSGVGSLVQVLGHYSGTPGNVPEPGSLVALGLGVAVMARRRRKVTSS